MGTQFNMEEMLVNLAKNAQIIEKFRERPWFKGTGTGSKGAGLQSGVPNYIIERDFVCNLELEN